MTKQTKTTTATATATKTNAVNKEAAIKAALTTAVKVSKSQAMRDLDAAGFTRSQIKTILGVRYQFVKNVLDKGAPKRDAAASRVSELEQTVERLKAELAAKS